MSPLVQLLIMQMPAIIDGIKSVHKTQNPDAPDLTSQQVVDAFDQLFADSFAKDEMLRAALQAEIATATKPA